MKKLTQFLNGLSKGDRLAFCNACKTTEGYLRKAVSLGQLLGADLCILIDRESHGKVKCEDLRGDVDWQYLRNPIDPDQEQDLKK